MNVYGLPLTDILREVVANVLMCNPWLRRYRIKLAPRTSSPDPRIEARKLAAEFDFFSDSIGQISGKSIVEIGPGDAVGLAPLFISSGASSYTAFDRFAVDIFGARQRSLYDEISRIRGSFVGHWQDRVEVRPISIERVTKVDRPFADVIISFDVIEHLVDLKDALRNMASMLKPDGLMIHRIDYGPHGVWLKTMNPLSFLSVPNWLWCSLGSNRGYPNRVRHHEVLRLLESSGLKVTARATRTVGADVLDAEIACGLRQTRLGRCFVLPTP